MATVLPTKINFRLPDGWQAALPDAVGEPDMAFVALHPGSGANLTINGALRAGAATLTGSADESVANLRRMCPAVRVVERRDLDAAGRPGLTQVLALVADLDGTETRLVQTQVFLSFRDVYDAGRHAVVRFALTATPDRLAGPIRDFQSFLRTIRPAEPEPQFAGSLR
jgi:hypothetical protein